MCKPYYIATVNYKTNELYIGYVVYDRVRYYSSKPRNRS